MVGGGDGGDPSAPSTEWIQLRAKTRPIRRRTFVANFLIAAGLGAEGISDVF